MENSDIHALQYVPFNSFVDPSFWHKFSQIKLDIDKLEEKERKIWGYYSISDSTTNCELRVDGTSFNSEFSGTRLQLASRGTLVNKNTMEAFKEADKSALLDQHGRHMWADIVSGAALDDPTLLARFIVLSYADLKKHKFYSWFGFPAPNSPTVTNYAAPVQRLEQVLSAEQVADLTHQLQRNKEWCRRSCFTLHTDGASVSVGSLRDLTTPRTDQVFVVFPDPQARGECPGWPLRNLLALVACHCGHLHGHRLRCIGLRTAADSAVCAATSCVYDVIVPAHGEHVAWVGWERNQRGKFGPRMFDLHTSMSPTELAATAVDLNLKLMKWRLCPGIDLDAIRDTRCLLLGAGTLGCSVARNLMAWGVHRITLADNGTVSYSNPVRQSLYTHEHCLHGGRPKAAAAALSLAQISPGVASAGVELDIPMPGHPIGASLLEATRENVALLERLIVDHDAVFLLMDSRESRWLPTVMAASKGKIVMNAALGFDTYLVMRHGTRPRPPIEAQDSSSQPIGDQASSRQPIGDQACSTQPIGDRSIPGAELGCYFCNDVTAPGNSQADRSLDQQCTVARPGVSGIASALVVELFVSLIQHPDKAAAPADYSGAPTDSCVLGAIPHTVRGFLSQYQQVLPSCRRFPSCIACSDKVLSEYEARGFDFLLQVFNTPNYLEDITGLTAMKTDTADTEIWELESDDSAGELE